MRLIAHYLPQFYPTPYNNEAWGEGFTEWANVARALPQYDGHHQPRLPAKLGFYDLRVPEILHQQEELAMAHGIYGFAYYYYRFGGERRLELPLNNKINNFEYIMPYCICWANENWTRRWDGQDEQVLIAQQHSDADDASFIADAARMFIDERYIKVDGKALLLIYRTELWRDFKRTADMWRQYMWQNYKVGLYIVRCNGFQRDIQPEEVGCDAAYQFPPLGFSNGREALGRVAVYPDFEGGVPDYMNWRKFVQQDPNYKLLRGVMPSWDNTPRKMNKGHIIYGSSPEEYLNWLTRAMYYTHERFYGDERIIFINAWNEWAEGAILEPCKQHGYSYLNATAEAMRDYYNNTNGR